MGDIEQTVLGLLSAFADSPQAFLEMFGQLALATAMAVALLLVPGYLVMRLFRFRSLAGLDMFVLLLGLSLATVAVFGLVLHIVGALTSVGWRIAAGAAALGATFLASPAIFVGWRSVRPRRLLFDNLGLIASLAATTLIVGLAVAVARRGAINQRQFTYTELWILPSGDPRSIERAVVGIKNEEQQAVSYNVEILVNSHLLAQWPTIRLRDHGQWTKEFSIVPDLDFDQRVEARLYRTDRPLDIYRRVWLSHKATEESQCAC